MPRVIARPLAEATQPDLLKLFRVRLGCRAPLRSARNDAKRLTRKGQPLFEVT